MNTGEVVAGDPAAGQALVTGDAVNVAARLEQHAAPGEILLGASTYRLVRTAVHAEQVAPLDVKGKVEPLSAWRLLDIAAVPTAVPGYAKARRWWGETLSSHISGRRMRPRSRPKAVSSSRSLDPGAWGSRDFVDEFVSDLGDRATVALGVCLPYGEGHRLSPVVEAIKKAAGLTDLNGPSAVGNAISSVIEGDEHRALDLSRNLFFLDFLHRVRGRRGNVLGGPSLLRSGCEQAAARARVR